MSRATVRQCAVWLDTMVPEGVPKGVPKATLSSLLWAFVRFGVTDFLLLTDQPTPELEAAAATIQARLPARLRITRGTTPGNALRQARERLDPRFLACRGDSLLDVNLARLLANATADDPGIIGRLLLRRGQAAADGVLLEGSRATGLGWSELRHTGIGLFHRNGLDAFPDTAFPDTAFPGTGLPDNGNLPVLTRSGIVLGTVVERLAPPDAAPRRTLFLDRDGVINIDRHYVGTRDRFEWVPGARETIAHATDRGWHVFVVTNQSGIARGRYAEADLLDLHAWLCDEVRASGGTIDDIRYCPFHPDATIAAYRAHSSWRKPAPGMLLDLIRVWGLDPGRGLMIGDQETDMQAAAAAGVLGHPFHGGNLLDFARPLIDRAGP